MIKIMFCRQTEAPHNCRGEDDEELMPYPSGHRDKIREKILRSARRLFNRHGFENVTVN
jgi:hypothetical protein